MKFNFLSRENKVLLSWDLEIIIPLYGKTNEINFLLWENKV